MSFHSTYQLRQREYLLEISRAMTARLELGSLLRLILTSAAELVSGQVGLIALRQDDGRFAVRATYGLPTELLPHFTPLLEDIPYLSGRHQLAGWQIPDLRRKVRQVERALGVDLGQVIALPLTFEDELLGVIYLWRAGAAAFSPTDRQLLSGFADQAAIAVRNARLVQQLEKERQRLATVIENSADGIMILDAERRIQVFNRALSALTGWPAHEAIGRPCYQVLVLQDVKGHDICQAAFDRIHLPETGTAQAEGELQRPGGSRVTVGVTYTPVYDEDGTLINVIVNVTDITRFREAEQLKSTFVSVISHELKTPVSLIKGYATTLAREDAQWDPQTMREMVKVIEEEADRLDALINNLLDASRIQAGGLKLELADVNLVRLAERVVDAYRLQTEEHEFKLDFAPTMPTVIADGERIRQVLTNLISNAIKYSPNGGLIRVGGWYDDNWVTVFVADQGIGIPKEEQDRLFGRFYRVDSSLRRSTAGAGLGLYLVKSLVELHGGTVWLRSEPEKGTTVFFNLPRNIEETT